MPFTAEINLEDYEFLQELSPNLTGRVLLYRLCTEKKDIPDEIVVKFPNVIDDAGQNIIEHNLHTINAFMDKGAVWKIKGIDAFAQENLAILAFDLETMAAIVNDETTMYRNGQAFTRLTTFDNNSSRLSSATFNFDYIIVHNKERPLKAFQLNYLYAVAHRLFFLCGNQSFDDAVIRLLNCFSEESANYLYSQWGYRYCSLYRWNKASSEEETLVKQAIESHLKQKTPEVWRYSQKMEATPIIEAQPTETQDEHASLKLNDIEFKEIEGQHPIPNAIEYNANEKDFTVQQIRNENIHPGFDLGKFNLLQKKFESELDLLSEKATELEKKGHTKAYTQATILHVELTEAGRAYFANPYSFDAYQKFNSSCKVSIEKAREELSRHRNLWKLSLSISLVAISFGVAYGVAKVMNKVLKTERFDFFSTRSRQLINDIQITIEKGRPFCEK